MGDHSTYGNTLRVQEAIHLPDEPSPNIVYRLLPRSLSPGYYRERIDRNIGWITEEEQEILKESVVGIAGCGGMGGLLASILVRAGVGEVRIADNELFDLSNINRQFGALRNSVGQPKSFTTARLVRAISDDTTLVVYPQGIVPDTVDHFLADCTVVCDEIEFWAASPRLLLHQQAYKAGLSVFNCNTIGFGTRLFLFTPFGCPMERVLGMSYAEASIVEGRIRAGIASSSEVESVMNAVIRGLLPEPPEYAPKDSGYQFVREARKRLLEEGRATIIATNPPLAAGFLADQVLFYLLRDSAVKRLLVCPPPAPGYLYFDAGFMVAKAVERGML